VAPVVTLTLPGQVLTRYLARALCGSVLLVTVVLIGLYGLIEVIRESRALQGDYGWLEMMRYLLHTSPRRAYDIFPFAALIGTLLGLGSLVSSREWLAMRCAGWSRPRLVAQLMAIIGMMVLVLVVAAEWLIPSLESHAQGQRDQARSGELSLGRHGALWLRDGDAMIRIGRSLWLDDSRLEFAEVLIQQFDAQRQPVAVLTAEHARHQQGQWRLTGVVVQPLEEPASASRFDELTLRSQLSPELFAAAVTRPRLLSTRDLLEMRRFLATSELNAVPYERALWGRVFYPLNVLAMVVVGAVLLLAMPTERGGTGLAVFAGVVLGLGYFILVRLVESLALLWPLPIWLSSLLPVLVIAALAWLVLRR
jgi:lipopolysaccharide export system permease protein